MLCEVSRITIVAAELMRPSRRDVGKPSTKPEGDIAIEISIAIAALTTIGVVHGLVFYPALGINVFDYASASDFVVWSLRDPVAICVTIVAAVTAFKTLKSRFHRALAVIFWAAIISGLTSYWEQNQVKSGKGRVLQAVSCTIKVVDHDQAIVQTGITPIGSAGDFIFYYWKVERSTYAIPKQNVVQLGCAPD